MSQPKQGGKLEVVLGPMFSGKTSELIRRIQRHHLANYRCLIVKHGNKQQFSEISVTSHDDCSLPAVLASRLEPLYNVIKDFDVIGIDEGHLFADLNKFCETISDSGKIVLVAALDRCGDHIFKNVLSLIPLAESVTKLTAICMSCSNEATYTKQISVDEEIVENSENKFVPVCGNCYVSTNHSWRSPFQKYLRSNSAADSTS